MSSAVAKKGDQDVTKPGSTQAIMESKEQSASASANVRKNSQLHVRSRIMHARNAT
jgi:hypothetical protein